MAKKILTVLGIFVGVIFIVGIIASQTESISTQQSKQAVVSNNTTPEEQQAQYQVVYSKDEHRTDGAPQYWILIDAIDINTDGFKVDIQNVVRDMIKKEGKKISLIIFDQLSALEENYNNETNDSRHIIATFDGDFALGLYLNQLSYFPAAIKDDPIVGQYVGSEDFN